MSKKREKQTQTIKEFIEREVIPCLDAHGNYERKVDTWTKRFEAVRSIQGLSYGDDPDKFPKLEPWKHSSDIGVPIEAITIRAIIARFVKTIFTKPICNVRGRGGQDFTDAKLIEQYQTYSLEEEMNFERQFYDVGMDVCLAGDGYGKLIEADEDYEWEETYFTLINPVTNEPILDPNTKNEYDQEWPNGYPIEVDENFQSSPDPATGITLEPKEITITKTDKTFFGTKLIPINPKDLILPKGADTHDLDELPWVGHKFKKSWFWLKEREGKPEEGGYENVDLVKPEGVGNDGYSSTLYSKNNLIEVWAKVDIDNEEGKKKPREIIALYERDKGELLGWIINPYRGKRMIFHWQIMPMPHRARGKSIPEFARGLRDLVDSLFNNMINRDTINSHPPFIYDEQSGFDPEIHAFGPHEFWGVNDKSRLGRLDMGNISEFRAQWIIEFTMGLIQRLFGVTDYTTGTSSDISENKTARGIMAIIGEGNMSFDTMIALLQMTNKKLFEANIRMHAKMLRESKMQDKVFYVTEEKSDVMRRISVKHLEACWNFIPRGTSMEANIHKKREDALMAYKVFGSNPFFSPQMSAQTMNNLKELTQNVADVLNVRNISLPSAEELQQQMVKMKADVQQEIQKRQQIEQLKKVAKFKKGTPEGMAAQKVLADIMMQEKPKIDEKDLRKNIQA